MDSIKVQTDRPYRRSKVSGKVDGCANRLRRVLLTPKLPGQSRRRITAAIKHLHNALDDLELRVLSGDGPKVDLLEIY